MKGVESWIRAMIGGYKRLDDPRDNIELESDLVGGERRNSLDSVSTLKYLVECNFREWSCLFALRAWLMFTMLSMLNEYLKYSCRLVFKI